MPALSTPESRTPPKPHLHFRISRAGESGDDTFHSRPLPQKSLLTTISPEVSSAELRSSTAEAFLIPAARERVLPRNQPNRLRLMKTPPYITGTRRHRIRSNKEMYPLRAPQPGILLDESRTLSLVYAVLPKRVRQSSPPAGFDHNALETSGNDYQFNLST
ncbi:uncharacterized protein H6S33_011082 [Morchella sextelata]|uniref:uncharacterized protein n=1 Tax=Morchella sextelata TaxID=1174677 RepID=UPI001D040CC6|nr:uncharacterized protein H6S33_011082 [Morchella sextelata]KAH0611817.1 hypothetical protein H6S33_011082 [Morchella sextelata]